jgi:Lrp/AsnC family transcriptional regulator, leucine-responsive regulatory protein
MDIENLSNTDLKILQELDLNTRITNKELSKKLEISPEMVGYRISQLEKKGIIKNYLTYFNLFKTNKINEVISYKILIKFKNFTKIQEEKLISEINKNTSITSCIKCFGHYDLILTININSINEYIKFDKKFFNEFGEFFEKKELLLIGKGYWFNDKFLFSGETKFSKTCFDENLKFVKIDNVDLKIIKEISKNSRISYVNLGKKIGLTYWATALRFKKLIENNVIVGFKPRLDFEKLNLSYFFLLIEINDKKQETKIINFYKNHFAINYINELYGKFSIQIELIVKEEKIDEILNELRENFANKFQSYELLKIQKEFILNIIR